MLPIISALTASCIHHEEPIIQPEKEIISEAPADTVVTRLTVNNGGADWCKILKIDILIYDAEDLQELEKHLSFDCTDSDPLEIELQTTAGAKKCVVVANSTKDLDLKTLDRFSTMQSITFAYADENPETPVMTAVAEFTAGGSGGIEVTPIPFLGRVVIEEISNAMDGWVLMEEPEVYLSEINPEVGILQEEDFRPSATIEEGPYARLPCDIGFFSQHPGTVLHRYPNDTPERVLGGCRTYIYFSCKVEGETVEATSALPPVGRNGLTNVKITMSSEKELSFSF